MEAQRKGRVCWGEKEKRGQTVTELACLLDSSPTNKQASVYCPECLPKPFCITFPFPFLAPVLAVRSVPVSASHRICVRRGESGRSMCFKGLVMPLGSSSFYLTLPPSVKLSSRSPGDLVRATPAAAVMNPVQPQYVRRMMGFSLLNWVHPQGREAFGVLLFVTSGVCVATFILANGEHHCRVKFLTQLQPSQSCSLLPGQRASKRVKSNGLDSPSHIWMNVKLITDGYKHKLCAKVCGYISRMWAIIKKLLLISTIRSQSTQHSTCWASLFIESDLQNSWCQFVAMFLN